ncbi:hypothetical protein [Microbulbifer sp.]|uniref:hypothetical protein n=1 Tax=Microbulbifer sp. TaxID=1908541 RepID=UPI003F3F5288
MKQVTFAVLVGLVSALLGVLFTGYSAAIAIPSGLVDFFTGWRMFLWDTLVVQFLGYGVTILLLTFLVTMLLKLNPWITAALAVLACEASLAIAYPTSFSLYMPHIIVVVSCAFLGALSSQRIANA